MIRPLRLIAALGAWAMPATAWAQAQIPPAPAGGSAIPGALDRAFGAMNGGPGGGMTLSLQILILMGLLTILPSLILMMTSFTRILVVFSILRQAMGLQQSPPNQVLIGLALFLSLFVMSPTLDKVNQTAIAPYSAGQINSQQAIGAAGAEFHHFMMRQTRKADLAMFVDMAKRPGFDRPEDVPFSILLPAFVTSELKTAFQIGFMLYLPFLVIDLVVSSTLMSLGMMMMSPAIVSMPFKLLLFVMVDGWALLMGSLAASFG
ncbi:flagellar type III secretion system pore protein FliP [Novosphingobium sp. FSY-8]|uniref:Flagellar biosynthetic protein FliP n=1 Tax=Novosphingobium ovatum TaxID=1908523 RepID=A0ABW9XGC2_9SPHN|nr:flagellar type III secretion system pore protein FliP [Novosphingobium ovatum]NBC37519.1 flagellar type III secretion system pore protein FliP [Novosphingobium ovatum]